jgi:GT2 family glycosyltransferase
VDVLLKIDERSVWVQGWIHDRENAAARLTLLAPEGGRAELQPGMFRHRRQDIQEVFHDKVGVHGERHGFMRYAALDGPSHVSQGWLLELETLFGDVGERAVPPAEADLVTARERILPNLAFERPGSEELMREHVHPALARIQEHLRDAPAIESVVQIGEPPSGPSVSVIVPLYSQLWFMEYQMAHWASDPELPQQDLIYVLDTPEQATVLEERAQGLHTIYGIPFRLAVMQGNAGFAGVNNQAAQLARADKLLLLNSDIVPDAPGWLGRMTAFYDATPGIGALGPKLMYEDDSLQHAGLYFERLPEEPPLWQIMHHFKGQHRSLAAANVARQVPAVTGACMMVARELYERMGGLSYRYLQGGYEDTDFCIRLVDEGLEHWYMPGAELYHMEDGSYPRDLRQQTTRYNRWLHTELCGERIEALMAEFRGRDG